MYKVAYRNNFFGKVIIKQFKDETSAISAITRLKNKYYIFYTDSDMELHRGWQGKIPKTIAGIVLNAILYPSVSGWEIFKIEQPDIYKSIRRFIYINPIAIFIYMGMILTWLPINSASLFHKLVITVIFLISFRNIKHELESNAIEKILKSKK